MYYEDVGEEITPQPLYVPPPDTSKPKKTKKVVAIDNVGEPSPVMATFLKIATETVYKMAGLGAFEASVAYKHAMGEKTDMDEDGEYNWKNNPMAMSDTGDEVSENKDSVSLTESITFWQLSIAGTCLQVTDDNNESDLPAKAKSLDLEDRWTQTLDLPRKRKECQSDRIVMKGTAVQASNIDIYKTLKK